ncbi:hypothetical protein [Aeromonas enteropelogenes]|uniref:Uncharacterized protein n=1 Tax=Aeromonas enteropelogenes TaxID=29489 RepID=A0A175VL37_AEREN|nr:hypothetical protein [Aeromonas enteropelogenes]KXU81351.1 hypothetical protein LCR_06475 [Aeromonas enteropelogenes]
MNLSVVSQHVSGASEGLLAILRSSREYGDHFANIGVTPLAEWQPAKAEAAILLIDGNTPWQDAGFLGGEDDTIGLPVLPLLIRKGDRELAICGPDVRDPRFYFVSNGIVLEESDLANPASSRVLLRKLESYFPLLSRLIMLRQRKPAATFN